MAQSTRGSSSRQGKSPALLEWAAGATGAVIALGMLAVMAGEAVTSRPDLPPLIEIEPAALHSAGGDRFVLAVKVVNRSHQTAGTVGIEGELASGGAVVETSTASLTYVPGNSEAEAGLVFTRDPRRHRLRLRVLGYEKP